MPCRSAHFCGAMFAVHKSRVNSSEYQQPIVSIFQVSYTTVYGMRMRWLRIDWLNLYFNLGKYNLHYLFFLKFMSPCIVNIFQYISNKMQRYTGLLYLETALHVSGGTSTYHQERIQLYLQHPVFVTLLLLPAAIAAGSSNSVTYTRCCRYSCMRSWWWEDVTSKTCRAVSRYNKTV
jgi:hypothetical protein